jgi:hypothetical protein
MTTQILAKYSLQTIDSARTFSKNIYSRCICVKTQYAVYVAIFTSSRPAIFIYSRRQSSGFNKRINILYKKVLKKRTFPLDATYKIRKAIFLK